MSAKTCKNKRNLKEIAMISCIVYESMNIEKPTNNPKANLKYFTLLRKLEDIHLPYDVTKFLERSKIEAQVFTNEKALRDLFITKVYLFDPDIIVGHDICGGIMDLLINRITFLRVIQISFTIFRFLTGQDWEDLKKLSFQKLQEHIQGVHGSQDK